jgi:hypothetical protein
MTWVAATVFGSVTSISKTTDASYRARGLRLHEGPRTRSFVGKSITIMLKGKPTQLKTTHRKVLTTFKRRKICIWGQLLRTIAKLHH